MDDFSSQRERMVGEQLASRGLHNLRVLASFRQVPRHLFVPPDESDQAYLDSALPIGSDQTISQPYIVALMTSLLNLQPHETALEIGTGSGYQAAILSNLVQVVHTIERFPDLAEAAQIRLTALGYTNVFVHVADGTLGWPPDAPYDGIIIAAAAPYPPGPILDQMAEGGRMVLPVGGRKGQTLQLWTRMHGKLEHKSLISVSFVPLIGKYGWG